MVIKNVLNIFILNNTKIDNISTCLACYSHRVKNIARRIYQSAD